jgi:hypothetical protein
VAPLLTVAVSPSGPPYRCDVLFLSSMIEPSTASHHQTGRPFRTLSLGVAADAWADAPRIRTWWYAYGPVRPAPAPCMRHQHTRRTVQCGGVAAGGCPCSCRRAIRGAVAVSTQCKSLWWWARLASWKDPPHRRRACMRVCSTRVASSSSDPGVCTSQVMSISY